MFTSTIQKPEQLDEPVFNCAIRRAELLELIYFRNLADAHFFISLEINNVFSGPSTNF